MPYDKTTGIITEPLNINKGGDIQQAVNYNSGDLGDCIRNGKVNKWSFHKPVRFNTLGRLTSEQIGSVQCGLIPVTLPRLVQMSIGYTGGSSYTKEQCITQVAEWGYNKPRGRNGGGSGVHEWYRHLDFSSYNAKAIAPDSGWAQMNIEQEDVTKMSSMTVEVETSGSYTGRNFKLTPKYDGTEYGGGLYTAFAMRFGDGYDIGRRNTSTTSTSNSRFIRAVRSRIYYLTDDVYIYYDTVNHCIRTNAPIVSDSYISAGGVSTT